MSQPGNTIAKLGKELQYQSSRAAALDNRERRTGRPIIIMGDQQMPYQLLKRIMSTCAENDYRTISLAVNSTPPAADAGATQVARR